MIKWLIFSVLILTTSLTALSKPKKKPQTTLEHWQAAGIVPEQFRYEFSRAFANRGAYDFFTAAKMIQTAINTGTDDTYIVLVGEEVDPRIEASSQIYNDHHLRIVKVEKWNDMVDQTTPKQVLETKLAAAEALFKIEADERGYLKNSDLRQTIDWLFNGIIPESHHKMARGLAFTTQIKLEVDPNAYHIPKSMDRAWRKNGVPKSFVGIGISYQPRHGKLEIVEVVEDSSAGRYGLKVGDHILAIDGVEWQPVWPLRKASKLIKEKKGPSINLRIQRGDSKPFDVTLKREKYIAPNIVSAGIEHENTFYGYIQIGNFVGEGVCEDFISHLEPLKKDGIEGLILDLSANAGGNVGNTLCVAEALLGQDKKFIDKIDIKTHKVLSSASGDLRTDFLFQKQLLVLVSAETASSAELLAGLIQEYQRGLLIGERTYGKGTLQSKVMDKFYEISTHVTTGYYVLPSGRSPQLVGITPDISYSFGTRVLREEDKFINSVPAFGSYQMPSQRKAEIHQVKNCLKRKTQPEDSIIAQALSTFECF